MAPIFELPEDLEELPVGYRVVLGDATAVAEPPPACLVFTAVAEVAEATAEDSGPRKSPFS